MRMESNTAGQELVLAATRTVPEGRKRADENRHYGLVEWEKVWKEGKLKGEEKGLQKKWGDDEQLQTTKWYN